MPPLVPVLGLWLLLSGPAAAEEVDPRRFDCEHLDLDQWQKDPQLLARALAASRAQDWYGFEAPGDLRRTDWASLRDGQRFNDVRRVLAFQLCKAAGAVTDAAEIVNKEPRKVSGCSKDLSSWLEKVRAVPGLFTRLETAYPWGYPALIASLDPKTVSRLEPAARGELDRFGMIERQCRYGKAQLATESSARAFQDADPEGAVLEKGFDGARLAPRGTVPHASFAPRTESSPKLQPSARSLPAGEPPPESYEALTAGLGIRFEPNGFDPSRRPIGLPDRSDKDDEAIFQKALRYLADIPRGRKVLGEVQAMRKRFADENRAYVATLRTKKNKTFNDYLLINALDNGRDFRPRITIVVGPDLPLEGGHADLLFQTFSDGSAETTIHLGRSWFQDGNPERAVDKVLCHELQHVADRDLVGADYRSGLSWLITEDRAYLSEGRAVMEQLPAMAKEKKSAAVESMRKGEVARMLKDPTGFRLAYLGNPLYLWDYTPADLKDPETAVRERLAVLWGLIRSSKAERRAAILAQTDYAGEIWVAYKHTLLAGTHSDLESLLAPQDASKVFQKLEKAADPARFQSDFVATALTIDSVRTRLSKLKEAASGKTGAQDKERLAKAEDGFWTDLESFVREYGNAR